MTQLIVQAEGGAVTYQVAKVAHFSDGAIRFRTTGGEEYSMTVNGNSIVPGTELSFWFPVLPAVPSVWTVTAVSDDAVQMETAEGNHVTMAIDGKCIPLDASDSLSAETLEV
jgi:hypothetical protein